VCCARSGTEASSERTRFGVEFEQRRQQAQCEHNGVRWRSSSSSRGGHEQRRYRQVCRTLLRIARRLSNLGAVLLTRRRGTPVDAAR